MEYFIFLKKINILTYTKLKSAIDDSLRHNFFIFLFDILKRIKAENLTIIPFDSKYSEDSNCSCRMVR